MQVEWKTSQDNRKHAKSLDCARESNRGKKQQRLVMLTTIICGKKVYLIVEFDSFCIVCIGFSSKCCTGNRLGSNLATKNTTNNIIILQRSVQPGKKNQEEKAILHESIYNDFSSVYRTCFKTSWAKVLTLNCMKGLIRKPIRDIQSSEGE